MRSNDNGDLVVTKGDQYDVKEALISQMASLIGAVVVVTELQGPSKAMQSTLHVDMCVSCHVMKCNAV